MTLLLDTHLLVHWLANTRRLTKEQVRVLRLAERRGEKLGVSAVTLLELALHARPGNSRLSIPPLEILQMLEADPSFEILPLTPGIARVHGLRLVTSDARILAANVVSTVA